jgi:hypothetical protein
MGQEAIFTKGLPSWVAMARAWNARLTCRMNCTWIPRT